MSPSHFPTNHFCETSFCISPQCRWLFGTVGCQAYAFEGMVSGIVSILTIAALSVERYFAAKEPQFCKLETRELHTVQTCLALQRIKLTLEKHKRFGHDDWLSCPNPKEALTTFLQ